MRALVDVPPKPSERGQAIDAADIDGLRRRLGDARLGQRLSEEVFHIAGQSHQEDPFLGLSRFVDVDRLVERVVRLAGCWGWGYRNFQAIRVVEHPICHPRLPTGLAGLTILQLSDLHLDLDPIIVERIAQVVDGLDYDLVVLTGDLCNTTHADPGPSVTETLALLPALTRPVYAVLGNHDFIEIVPPLERAGVRFLLNEVVPIEHRGARLFLAGIDDPHFYRTHDLAGVREQVPADGFSVLLSHSPEVYREAAAHGFDVMLSGHTHGGQICLPGGYALIKVCDVPRGLLKGTWQRRGLIGYTSPGTGSCGVPLRFFCPPEVTLHRLSSAAPAHGWRRVSASGFTRENRLDS